MFRYLDQLGCLAKQEVRVVMHNTLVARDYGLMDEKTLAPKPNYWGALLWRRLMGTTVLESPNQSGLHVYAHCLRGAPGGVASLVINTATSAAQELTIPVASQRYTLAATELQPKAVQLNGATLELGPGDEIPRRDAVFTPGGNVSFAPATITFLALPAAGNPACR